MLIMIEVGPGFEYPLPLLHNGQVYAALGVDREMQVEKLTLIQSGENRLNR